MRLEVWEVPASRGFNYQVVLIDGEKKRVLERASSREPLRFSEIVWWAASYGFHRFNGGDYLNDVVVYVFLR